MSGEATPPPMDGRIAIVMVGLPARGKTYTARKLARYLGWLGYRARLFNVGNYRRERVGAQMPAEFFDPDNAEAEAIRGELATQALDDMLAWLASGGQIGIYDATNSTAERRARVRERCERAGAGVLFVELICEDRAVIEANIRETKVTSPDYADVDPETAARDFRNRIANYERAYETIGPDEASYVKMIDSGRQIVVNRIEGYVAGRIVQFLVNLHTVPRRIWLTRHGESLDNLRGVIGGDSSLGPRGTEFAGRLRDFVSQHSPQVTHVWTSTLKRSIETAWELRRSFLPIKALDEIDAGVFDGLTYGQIEAERPDEFSARKADKLRYRYPRGESYEDVIRRVDPVLAEIERHREPVLVIGHQAVLRCLYAYLADVPREQVPYVAVPLHTVLELTPKAYGCDEKRYPLGPDA
jgi:broad specificity phosphatase PhoE/predicted kinase